MMAIPIILTVAAGAMQAMGSITAASNAAGEQLERAKANEEAARVARGQASAREEIVRRDNSRRLGEQRAAVAQSGFDPQTGSTLALQGESAREAELDSLTEFYRGRLQSTSLENEAGSLRARAKVTRRQGYLNAAGTVLSTAAKAYGMGAGMPTSGGAS